jgi:hypothetical protein
MALEASCQSYVGSLIAVKPVYGWGWTRHDAPEIPVPDEVNGVPHRFHCRVIEFFYFRDQLRGAVGKVEEPGHLYGGLWIVFSTRVVGIYNFTDRVPYCDLQIGTVAPAGEWPEFNSGSPIVNGYGFVGASLRHIEENDAGMRPEEKDLL